MDISVVERSRHSRKDGWLVELFTRSSFHDFSCVHSYLVSIMSNCIRAKHYHNKKTEIIASVFGKVEIILEDIKTHERISKVLSSDDENFKMLIIPPKIAHAVKNPTDITSRIVVFSDSKDLSDTHTYNFRDLL